MYICVCVIKIKKQEYIFCKIDLNYNKITVGVCKNQ